MYSSNLPTQFEKEPDLLKLATHKIDKGLKYFPNDEHCIRLKCRIHKILSANDIDGFSKLLLNWYNCSTIPNAWLLYELGRAYFILGYYDYSKKYFKELESGVGIGNTNRMRPKNPYCDINGETIEFEGTVIKIFSIYEGLIRCDALRNLKYPIMFRPIASNYNVLEGDQIVFNIAFNFLGARAENVKKH